MPAPQTLTSPWVPPGGSSELRLSFGAATHPGAVRKVNEDGWFTAPPIFMVADGMGGHRAGDVASAIVVESFQEMAAVGVIDIASIEACIARCQQRIASLAEPGASNAPGSTVVAAIYIVEDNVDYWLLVNVGDSRAYIWTIDRLDQISRDHSVVQELIDAGELDPRDATSHPERHVITRALGAIQDAPADYSLVPATAGSKILLCSDGVTSELDDEALALLLGSQDDPGRLAAAIVTAAIDAGGRDNATAVVVAIDSGARRDDTLGRGLRAVPVETTAAPDGRSRS